MYKKCYQGKKLDHNLYEMHLWEEDGKHQVVEYKNTAYVNCSKQDATLKGLNGEFVKPITNWRFSKNQCIETKTPQDYTFMICLLIKNSLLKSMELMMNLLQDIEKYFLISRLKWEVHLLKNILEDAPKPVTSIAWFDKQEDKWSIIILDKKKQLNHTKARNKEIIPVPYRNRIIKDFC